MTVGETSAIAKGTDKTTSTERHSFYQEQSLLNKLYNEYTWDRNGLYPQKLCKNCGKHLPKDFSFSKNAKKII